MDSCGRALDKARSSAEVIDGLIDGLKPAGAWLLKRNQVILGHYRGTSLTRKRPPLGPYRRPMPRVLGGS